MPAAGSGPVRRGSRWNSFIAEAAPPGEVVRRLHEASNPAHRLRVEHDGRTLLIHLSGEDGRGWTTIAVDRTSRAWAVAQEPTQSRSGSTAYERLYGD